MPTHADRPAHPEAHDIDWAGLALRLLHPTKVSILEALAHIELPLSATQLTHCYEDPPSRSLITHHLKGLEKSGIVIESGHRTVRGAVETFYGLAGRTPRGPSRSAVVEATANAASQQPSDRRPNGDIGQSVLSALKHPLRRRILRHLRAHPEDLISPSELSRAFREPLSGVSYHVRELYRHDALVLVRMEPIRGSSKHYYRPNVEFISQPGIAAFL